MFGIDDPWIIAAYVLLFGSTAACVIYGIWKWNETDDEEA